MKTLSIILFLIFTFIQSGFANDDQYQEAMKKTISALNGAQSVEEFQQAVNAFERIGNVERTRWEPFYYAAFGNTMMAMREKERVRKDQYLDLAMASVERAKAIVGDESEVITMEGFIYTIRVAVDPGARGPQFAGLAMQILGKASALNPENPRALTLMAQMQYGTAQFLGSSTAEPCATANKALEKFESYKSENPLAPQWGRPMAEQLKSQCK